MAIFGVLGRDRGRCFGRRWNGGGYCDYWDDDGGWGYWDDWGD